MFNLFRNSARIICTRRPLLALYARPNFVQQFNRGFTTTDPCANVDSRNHNKVSISNVSEGLKAAKGNKKALLKKKKNEKEKEKKKKKRTLKKSLSKTALRKDPKYRWKESLVKVQDQIKESGISPKPRKPPSGYLLFSMDRLRAEPLERGNGAVELSIRSTSEWGKLDEKTKQEYLDRGRIAIASYSEEYRSWRKSLSPRQKFLLTRVRTLKRSLSGKKKAKPMKRANAFFAFMRANKHLREGKTLIEFSCQMALTWKEMSLEEKELWKQRAIAEAATE